MTETYEFFPENIRDKIASLRAAENQSDPIVWVKFFTPDANWTWYVIEFDEQDLFFGLVEGFEVELGYFSLTELKSVRGPLGLRVERDIWFKPAKLSVIKESISKRRNRLHRLSNLVIRELCAR